MSRLNTVLKLSAALALSTGATSIIAMTVPSVAMAQVESKTVSADQAFPLLKGFVNLPAAERDQISLGYILRVKDGNASDVKITLNHNGKQTPIAAGSGGRLSPLPTREQLNGGAKVTVSAPKSAKVSMKLRTYSTQAPSKSLDAKLLAKGVTQGNNAVKKIAGVLAVGVAKLDRAVFVGGSGGVAVMADGQQKPLPTYSGGDYPAGTPYFVPSQMPTAVRITLTTAPSSILYDTPSK